MTDDDRDWLKNLRRIQITVETEDDVLQVLRTYTTDVLPNPAYIEYLLAEAYDMTRVKLMKKGVIPDRERNQCSRNADSRN